MRKNRLFATLLVVALCTTTVFASCNRNDETGVQYEVRKLPSRIVLTFDDNRTRIWTFEYDSQNRLTKLTNCWLGTIRIEYDTNNRILRTTHTTHWGSEVRTFQYVGNNLIIISSEQGTRRITLNANGQMIRNEWERAEDADDEGGRTLCEFTYTDGNLTERILHVSFGGFRRYAYSNVLNVFRNATSPEWLIYFLSPDFFPPSRYMLSKLIHSFGETAKSTFAHQTDTDGYVTSSKIISTTIWGSEIIGEHKMTMTFEYILAN